jgi:predicted nucleotidyltransferase component of viral defense system
VLEQQIRRIVQADPDYAAITPVIEKEILHHDLIDVLVKQGLMQRLTFIGGTSLRLCYDSSRLSEDLDFNGGHDFDPSEFEGLEYEIQAYLQNKYETDVWVSKPSSEKQSDTVSWKMSIAKEANRPDLPRQKMHIDVCAIPSFDIQRRPLLNHYQLVVPTEGLLIPVQSLQEALADKLIALAYRSRRIKPRDIWDIVWLRQRGTKISKKLVQDKLAARQKQIQDFRQALSVQLGKLLSESETQSDFNMEMSRFIPKQIRERTLDNPDYWPYVQNEVNAIASELLTDDKFGPTFDMG